MKIGLVNLKTGNIRSLKNMLDQIDGLQLKLIDNSSDLLSCDSVVVSGVSSFDYQIKQLKEKQLFEHLKEEKNKKIIGICCGMQIFFDSSEEGNQRGFGIFQDKLLKFDDNLSNLPHTGWNDLNSKDPITNKASMYFCHSYYANVNSDYTIAKTNFSVQFSSIVKKNNFLGFQFHPEKSGSDGLKILKYFIHE